MPVCNLSDLSGLMKPGQCLLGLDPGSKTVGVAIADPASRVASPLVGLAKKKQALFLDALAAIVRERNVGGMVVGLPKDMVGREGPAAQAARSLAHAISHGPTPLPDLPIAFWDERFSTAAVTRFMIEDDLTRKRRSQIVDKTAAAYILQGALDAMAQNEGRK